ncbi:MAG: hypothetical protein ABI402_17735 [Ferruginibacter sp.]
MNKDYLYLFSSPDIEYSTVDVEYLMMVVFEESFNIQRTMFNT